MGETDSAILSQLLKTRDWRDSKHQVGDSGDKAWMLHTVCTQTQSCLITQLHKSKSNFQPIPVIYTLTG